MILEMFQLFLKAIYKNSCQLSFKKKYSVKNFIQKKILTVKGKEIIQN